LVLFYKAFIVVGLCTIQVLVTQMFANWNSTTRKWPGRQKFIVGRKYWWLFCNVYFYSVE
jgi:hypothetical protein